MIISDVVGEMAIAKGAKLTHNNTYNFFIKKKKNVKTFVVGNYMCMVLCCV